MTAEFTGRRFETEESSVFGRSSSSIGMDLGELRKVVALAEGMADSSDVNLEEVSASNTRHDEYWFRVIRIRDQKSATVTPECGHVSDQHHGRTCQRNLGHEGKHGRAGVFWS